MKHTDRQSHRAVLLAMLVFPMLVATCAAPKATTAWHILATNTVPSCGVTALSYVGASIDGSVIVFIRPSCIEEFWTSN